MLVELERGFEAIKVNRTCLAGVGGLAKYDELGVDLLVKRKNRVELINFCLVVAQTDLVNLRGGKGIDLGNVEFESVNLRLDVGHLSLDVLNLFLQNFS